MPELPVCINCGYEIKRGEEAFIREHGYLRYYHASYVGCQESMRHSERWVVPHYNLKTRYY